MAVSKGFVELLRDLLSGFAPISVRRMFSGAGVFADGVMFALVIDDVLFLKTDEQTRTAFEAEGLAPFSFVKQRRRIETSYWRAPEQLLDDPDELIAWSRRALEAAKRIAARKPADKNGTRRTQS
jgi:DNA transformation protein